MRFAAVALVACARLQGQEAPPGQARPTLRAQSLAAADGPIRLDGRLDETVWQRAPSASGLRQREPDEGAAATEETELRVLHDGRTLYVGVLARDRQPEAAIARILQRDRLMEQDFLGQLRFSGDDAVAIVLDPFHDHRNGVVFATNALGAEFDALVTDEGREVNISWRGIWSVAARRTPEGWSAEFAIPFATLRFAGNGTFGLNLYRMIRRKNEEVLWTGWSRSGGGFLRLSQAGHLDEVAATGRRGLNIEVKPFAVAGATREVPDSGPIERSTTLEPGLDVKYEVRPGLVLDATLNTDFAQVEVDDEQVNLTRFDLFLPEKRDFFLENAGIFGFGVRTTFEPPAFFLFFSRQIGIAEDGEVPVIGGARLSGRAGRQTIGVLDVVTDAAWDQQRTNFAVLRVKRDVGGNGYLGAMLTDRRSADTANTAGGLDFSYWPGRALNLQGFVAGTATTGPGGDDLAYRLALDYQGDRWGLTLQHFAVGPDADARMGFITRTDIRRTGGFGRLTPRPRALGLRKVDVFYSADYATRLDGELQDWSAGVAAGPEWESGESVLIWHIRSFSRLDESFDLADSIPVDPGDYRMANTGWAASTSRARALVLNTEGSVQRFYGGSLVSVTGGLNVAAGSHLGVGLTYTYSDADMPNGAFVAQVARLRLSYAFTTRLSANALLQWNSLDRELSANVRVNFIHRPGSDLFIVLNEERGSDTSAWAPHARGVRVKLTYLARL